MSRPYPPARARRASEVPTVPSGAAADTPPDLVFIVGPDATIHYCNRSAADRVSSDVLATSLLDYIAPEHREAARAALDRSFQTGDLGGYECRGVPPFTEGCWYECRVAANERDGRIVSATIIARDVTRSRTAELALRAGHDRLAGELKQRAAEIADLREQVAQGVGPARDRGVFQTLLDQAGEAVLVVDAETNEVVDANETACRWLGMARERLRTLTSADFDLGFVLDEPERSREHVTDTRSMPRPRVRLGEVVRRRDGSSFPVEVSMVRRRIEGHDYLLVVGRDLHGREEAHATRPDAEDTFRSLFELAHEPIYLSARDGTVADVNKAAISLFGYSRDEFVGLPASKLYARPGDIRAFQQGVSAHGIARDVDVELVTRGGGTIRAQLTARYRHAADGSVLGYQCLVRPVSQGVEPTMTRPIRTRTGFNTVLVIDPDLHVLKEVSTALERATIPAVTTQSLEAGAEVLRPQSQDVALVVLGVSPDRKDLAGAVARLHHADARVPIVLMCEQLLSDAELSGLPGVTGVVRKPVYPLALVEQVRQALR